MSSVGSILGTATGLNEKSRGTAATTSASQSDANTTASTEQTDTTTDSGDSIQLSTRAQNLQKLKEEFYPGGYKSIKITPAFIQRLQEYGFLSAEDAKRLSPSSSPSSDNPATGKLEELSRFIDRLSGDLAETDPHNSLIDTLNKAGTILDSLDGSYPGQGSGAGSVETKSVIAELSQYSASEKAQSLSENDRLSLHSLETALRVADKLNRGGDVTSQINSYLAILQQNQN